MKLPEIKQKNTRTAPSSVRREQLISATITSISKHGISGTTMTTVTKLAGLSAGLANFHFKSKDALLEATLRHLAQEHRTQWRKRMDRPGLSAAQQIKAIIDAQFHPHICSRKNLTVWFAFFGEAAYRKSYRAITTQIDTERFDVLSTLFAQIIDNDDSPLAAKGVTHTVESLFDGFWLNMLMYPELFKRENAIEQMMIYLSTSFPKHFDCPTP